MKLTEGDEAFDIIEANDENRIIIYGGSTLVKSTVKDISLFERNSTGNGLVKEGGVTNIHLI